MNNGTLDFLYPEIEPFNETFLTVSEQHTVHFEQCGNPNGKPVLFVHGGPGGGIDPIFRRFFNPAIYHVILVNQRGSGKSTPHAAIDENTTQHLIADFEKIRQQLNIDQWMLFGGSWGSTLSLAYAQAHPDRVSEMILRGIYLATEEENQWLFNGQGANKIFPDYWQPFIDLIPEDEHSNLLEAYYQRLTSSDESIRHAAAQAWSAWEISISKLHHNPQNVIDFLNSPAATSMARLECHYMRNLCFLKPNQLLDNMDRIQHIPGIIVQGRYDIVCAPKSAHQLHQAWPQSTLHFVTEAGHSMADPALARKLLEATDQLAT